MDFLNIKRKKREETEINLTPILDMLVSIIFFLLIFCVFSEYSQLSLPAVAEVASSPDEAPALSPKVLVRTTRGGKVSFDLSWEGLRPGRQQKSFYPSELNTPEKWLAAVKNLILPLAQVYPDQKSIEVGMEGQFNYQHLLFVIDGLAASFPDVALIDPKKVLEAGRPQ